MTKEEREVMRMALEALTIFREWELGQDYNSNRDTVLVRAFKAEEAIEKCLANDALEKKAENARELGLDYYQPCCSDQTCPKCKATTPPKPWEKFCDSYCVWTNHHPDCKLAEQHQDWCASLTQMLMSMPPKPAPCNCKPPQRTWVGLTLDERIDLADDVDWPAGAYCEYAEKIEAKLKELNT